MEPSLAPPLIGDVTFSSANLSVSSAILVAFASFAASLLAIYFLQVRRRNVEAANAWTNGFLSDGMALIFSSRVLVAASEDATEFLSAQDDDRTAWKVLTSLGAEVEALFEDLLATGRGFTIDIKDQTGVVRELEGRPRGKFAAVYLRDVSSARSDLHETRLLLDAVSEDRDRLKEMLQSAPVAIWRCDPEGAVLWANSKAAELGDETSDLSLPDGFDDEPADADSTSHRRVVQPVGGEGAERWFDVSIEGDPTKETTVFATEANAIVKVEFALKRFIATLTETFAHLPTGLAIFDEDRKLNMFNPALAELMRLDPGWLAQQPTLRNFMLRLRDVQMMPEEKNSDVWRERVQKMEQEAVSGEFSENWALPSGQTFEVTGRPHPHGAVAFLFEDISTHITLEQKYQSELALSQVTLDTLAESVCVFDTTGTMVFCNAAFARIWEFDPMETLAPASISEISARWSEASVPSPVWGDLREFTTSPEQRASWNAEIELLSGAKLDGAFAPLPDGSTLMVFNPILQSETGNRRREAANARSVDTSIMELAIEHMREALQSLSDPRVRSVGEDTENLVSIPNDIANAVEYTERLLKRGGTDYRTTREVHQVLSGDLSELLGMSEASFDLSCEQVITSGRMTTDVRRLLVNLTLAARGLLAKGSHVDVTVAEMETGVSASCMFKMLSGSGQDLLKASGLPGRILDRFVSERNGHIEFKALDKAGLVKIACTIETDVSSDQARHKMGA